jgi:hypothetical protein
LVLEHLPKKYKALNSNDGKNAKTEVLLENLEEKPL